MDDNKNKVTIKNKNGKTIKGKEILKSIKWEIITLIVIIINSFHNYELIGTVTEFVLFSKLLYDNICYVRNDRNELKSKVSSTGITINLTYITLAIIVMLLIYSCVNILNILF